MATDETNPVIDSRDLPSNGGDAEVPEGMAAKAQGTDIEGTGSGGGIGTGPQITETSGDLKIHLDDEEAAK